MITAAVSTLLGIFGGLIPDVFEEIKKTREHTREMAFMDKQSELQLKMLEKKTDAKLAEIDANVVVEEMRAFAKQMAAIYQQQQPTGIKWIDGFNALIRPSTAALMMVMFFIIATVFSYGVIDELGANNLKVVADVLWDSMVGEAIQAVLGYLFGYRTSSGKIAKIREGLR